jgi:hypothetical protein
MTFYFLPVCRICRERHRVNDCKGVQSKPKFDRRAYQRDYMRVRRKRKRESVECSEPASHGDCRGDGEQLSLLTLFDKLESAHVT